MFSKLGLKLFDRMKCPLDLNKRVQDDLELQWFLYDLDLLPEQITTGREVCALRGFIYGWDTRQKLEEQKMS